MIRIADYIPYWLAWPFGMLSTLAALGGVGLIFWSAAFGEYVPAIYGAVVFAAAAILWHIADMAAHNRPIR
jgi:hypothetical protein